MKAKLNIITKILAYSDPSVNQNPRLRMVDWYRDSMGFEVEDPKTESHSIPAGESKLIFNGTRTLGIDNTTVLSLLPTLNGVYRLSYLSGTVAGFRTNRDLTLDGITVTFEVNSNSTVNLSVPPASLSNFTGVVVGDSIFVPNTETGDLLNVISHLNSGFWTVLGVQDSENIVIGRPVGNQFEAVSETVTLTSDTQIQAFSSNGVQANDTLDIVSGFSAASRSTYTITNVTADWIEFASTLPLASETLSPTANGIKVYTDCKIFVYLEADQNCVVRLNGDTGDTQKVRPLDPSDPESPGMYLKCGPTYSMTLVNSSTQTLNVVLIHAE